MVYLPLKPASADNLSVSQNDIQQNFQTANDVMNVNHYPFDNNTANKGKHKFCEFPVGTIPIGLAIGEATLYGKNATSLGAGNEGNLWFTSDNLGKEYQLTRAINGNFASFSANPGWTFLPGGLLMQYGILTTTSGGSTSNGSATYPVTFATATTAYSLQLTVLEATNSRRFIKVATSLTTGFTCWVQDDSGSNTANTVYWVAIGK